MPIHENKYYNLLKKVVFSLPSGFMVSGVTTWSVEISRQINMMNQKSTLVRHAPPELDYSEIQYSDTKFLNIVDCPGIEAYLIKREDILPAYRELYNNLIPATFVPNWSPAIYTVCASLALEKPDSLRVIGYAHSDEPYYYQTLQYFEPIISKFVAVSQEVGIKLSTLIPHREKDILIRTYPVHMAKSLKRKYTTSPRKPLQIVYAGRLQKRQKRILDLALLAQNLIEENINFHLSICGDGPDEDELHKAISSISDHTKENVTFVGLVSPDEMKNVWLNADICLLVSNFEGTSITMLEAMANGCVPLVTNVSGMRNFIEHGKTGYLTEIGDIQGMTSILKMLDLNRNLLATIGYQAYGLMRENNSYEEYVKWFLDVCLDIWQSPGKPWPNDRSIYFPEV